MKLKQVPPEQEPQYCRPATVSELESEFAVLVAVAHAAGDLLPKGETGSLMDDVGLAIQHQVYRVQEMWEASRRT